MSLTRREFGGVVAGGLLSSAFSAASPVSFLQSSRIAGVRLGTQSYSFRDRALDDVIAGIKTVGLAHCELWSGHVETKNTIPTVEGMSRREAVRKWRLDSKTIDYFKEIRGKFDAAGIALTSYDVPFNPDFTDEEIAAVFQMADALGVRVVTSSAKVSVAPRVEPHAAKAAMRVGFHNHSRIAPDEFATPDDFATAMKAGPHMAITLDVGHFTAANFDPLAFLDEHHDHIVSMHIKDSKRDQGPLVPFGEGDAKIAEVLRRLRDRKWDIPAHIEYEYKGQDTVEEMKRLFGYCRQVLEAA